MTLSKRIAVVAMAMLPFLAACQTNEQTGGLMGALGGGALGAGLGSAFGGNKTGALLGAGLGAMAGYFVGSSIGRQLDERDRQVATSATFAVLNEEPSPSSSSSSRAARRPVAWHSDHSGARGSAKVVAAQRQANGGECKTVQEVAYIKGQEVQQQSRYCRTAGGEWAAA